MLTMKPKTECEDEVEHGENEDEICKRDAGEASRKIRR